MPEQYLAGTNTSGIAAFVTDALAPTVADARKSIEAVSALAHYTTPTALRSILNTEEIWCSNVRAMNDWSEVIGGAQIVFNVVRQKYPTGIASIEVNLAAALDNAYKFIHEDTYVFCLSRHDANETPSGRLAMWRAYGLEGNGICIVLKKEPLLGQEASKQDFPLKWTPMIYSTPSAFEEKIVKQLEHLEAVMTRYKSVLESMNSDRLGMFLATFLLLPAISHKNVAFEDEREARFVYSPFLPVSMPEDGLRFDTAMRGDKLRPILCLKLREYSEYGLKNTTLRGILDHVIVGPSVDQSLQRKAIEIALRNKGLGDVPIHLSSIPYRTI